MTNSFSTQRRAPFVISALFSLLVAVPLAGQKLEPEMMNQPMNVLGLAGQTVPVFPLTVIVADTSVAKLESFAPWRDRKGALDRADSALAQYLQQAAPDVVWLLPDDLRRAARRSGGLIAEPDRMGLAVLRSPNMKKVPGNVGAQMRNLMSLTGGRVALVPAALGFGTDSTGATKSRLALVAVDTRRDQIIWRSYAEGTGASPDAALTKALSTLIPGLPTDVIAP